MKITPVCFLKTFITTLSIRKKTSLLFSFVFLFMITGLAVSINIISSQILIRKTVTNLMQNLEMVSEKLTIITEGVESYTKIAISNDELQARFSDNSVKYEDIINQLENSVNIQKFLNSIIIPGSNIDTILLLNKEYLLYNSGNVTLQNGQLNDIYKSFLKSSIVSSWSSIHPSIYKKNGVNLNVISFYRKFYNAKNGDFIGILEACIDEKTIHSMYEKINMGNSGELFIIDENGTIVSHKDKSLLYSKVNDYNYFEWIKHQEGGQINKIKGKDFLVLSKYNSKLDWIILGKIPVKEIIGDNKLLTNQIFTVGFICMVLAIMLSSLLSKSITRPLIQLKDKMKYVGEGNLDVRVNIDSRDEIGVVAEEFNKMVLKTSELMGKVYTEQKKKREFALALLQAQINPHFLYNTLDNICGLAELERKNDLIMLVGDLATFYRGVLSKGSSIITVKEELKIAESYLKILKMRYGDHLNYSFQIDELILSHNTIKLLLQPLIENSVVHGLRDKEDPMNIVIKGYLYSDKLIFEVIDNGIGMKEEKVAAIFLDNEIENYSSKSFGLKSTDERIKLYFGEKYGIEISSTMEIGTRICINLPAGSQGG